MITVYAHMCDHISFGHMRRPAVQESGAKYKGGSPAGPVPRRWHRLASQRKILAGTIDQLATTPKSLRYDNSLQKSCTLTFYRARINHNKRLVQLTVALFADKGPHRNPLRFALSRSFLASTAFNSYVQNMCQSSW